MRGGFSDVGRRSFYQGTMTTSVKVCAVSDRRARVCGVTGVGGGEAEGVTFVQPGQGGGGLRKSRPYATKVT